MHLLDQIMNTARQAAEAGGPCFLEPGLDHRWRPAPDLADGALRFDPEFSLPSVAGPVTWRVFYDSSRAALDGEYGFGRAGSVPLRLTKDDASGLVTVMHESGSLRTYQESPVGSGVYTAVPPVGGDALVTLTDHSWQETLGDSGLEYHFPAGDYSTLAYRATPQGQRLNYNYQVSAGGVLQNVSIQEPAGRRVTLSCNTNGKVQTVEDWGERGLVVLTYDPNDNLEGLWEQEGVVTRYAYDANHRPTYILDPAGFVTTYTYDSLGRVATRSVDGHLSQYDYSVPGEVSYTDPLGHVWTNYVDTGVVSMMNKGKPLGAANPLGFRHTNYWSNGMLQATCDALGHCISYIYDANGYVLSIEDQLGYFTTFTNDQYGNMLSVIDALGFVTTMNYGTPVSTRELTEIIDPLGNRTTFGYDTNGFPHSIEDAAGYRTTFGWSNLGVLASVMNARGFIWTYSYDGTGNRIETLDPFGYRWTYGYDQRGRLVSEQTPLGARWTTVYDARDLLQALVDPLGNRTTYAWTAEGSLTGLTDAAGSQWVSLYDGAERLTVTIDPLGNQTRFGYDIANRLTLIQDAQGNRTSLGYDSADRTIVIQDELGFATTYAYDATGRVVSILNARDFVTTYSYDAIGQVRSIINALGYVTTIDYDAAGRATVLHDPLGNRTTLQYDGRGLVIAAIDPASMRTTYGYSPTGLLQSVTDPRAQTWTSIYDAWDRLQASVNPLGHRATLIYDPAGRVSAVWDARGSRWTTAYDARDLAIGTTDPLGRQATLSYDVLGQLVTFTDQKAQLGTYTYSARYELTREQYADGTESRYAYDALGQIATCLDGTGSYTFTYDPRGDLTVVQAPQHPAGGILTYAYDAVANRVGLFSWLGPQTMTYDALDRCTSLLFDNASKRVTWLYDGLNRPTMQFHWNGARTTWAYDPRGLTNLIRHSKSDGTLLDFASYTYDQAGNPLSRITNATRATWSYDNASQLAGEQHSTSGLTDTFTYDPAGNRIQQARTQDGALTVSTLAYDAAGQLVTMLAGTALTTFLFDGNGNMQSENTAPTGTTTYLWDALDRMVGVIPPAGTRTTYAYRYDDLRASQNPGSGVQTSVWDVPGPTGYGDLFEELDSTSNPLRTYYRAADLAAQKDNTGTYAFHWMDTGTVELLSDASQVDAVDYAFTAWGELLSVINGTSTPLAWNGGWGYYGDTGARTWVRRRHLDVTRGRWLSRDPTPLLGSPRLMGREPRLHPVGPPEPYTYAGNKPTQLTDPAGLDWFDAHKAVIVNRANIIKVANAYGIQPALLAGVVWVENFANGKPGWNWLNDRGSYFKFVHQDRHASLGLTQFTLDPTRIPGCQTLQGRKAFADRFLANKLEQLRVAARLLRNLASRPNRYPGRTNRLTHREMAIILTEYNRGPTSTPAAKAAPSDYGRLFLRWYNDLIYDVYGFEYDYQDPYSTR